VPGTSATTLPDSASGSVCGVRTSFIVTLSVRAKMRSSCSESATDSGAPAGIGVTPGAQLVPPVWGQRPLSLPIERMTVAKRAPFLAAMFGPMKRAPP